jgi:cardiolipin synthase
MEYEVLSDPGKIYKKMLADIHKAKCEILLETYIYRNDAIGREFRNALIQKAREGVKVRLLIDAWGSNVRRGFFKDLISAGGKVRFFRELRYAVRFFNANHERNHRKLLLVDECISYIGSINITAECLDWEELVLRVKGNLAVSLRKAFLKAWNRFNLWKFKRMNLIVYEGFEILQDFPKGNSVERKYRKMILNARREILITTPYFIPSGRIRAALKKAIDRGVRVKIILPKSTDSLVLDVFRRRYLGNLHRSGVKIYYSSRFVHSKLLIVDRRFFLLGSSNVDYRSFMHQFEINLLGYHREVIDSLRDYFYSLLERTEDFDYDRWVKRHFLVRFRDWFIEKIVEPFRKYL